MPPRPTPEALFHHHHVTIFRFLRRLTSDGALAEDLTQEVFLRAIRSLSTYDPQERDLAWLLRIARRLAMDRAKAARRRPVLLEEEGSLPSAPPTQELSLALDQALARVPEAEREAFLLREVGGLGYEEIAAVTEVTPDAVRNRIYRARCSLRSALSIEKETSP